jgi:type IV pilus assembly protein PilC
MRFSYIASQPDGKIVEGTIEAEGTADVLVFLASQGLKPLSIKRLKGLEAAVARRKFFGAAITIADKIFLTKYLHLMLKVGADLFKALDILITDIEKPALKAFLIEVRSTLEKGQPFYLTFSRYPKYFSSVFVNSIKAGEVSGNLENVFADLTVMLEKEADLKSRIRSALIYPILLLSLAFLIFIFLVTFALPRIANIFVGGGFQPPAFSQAVFAAGLFIGKYIWIFLIVLFGLIIGYWLFISKTKIGKAIYNRLINSLPVIRGVVYKIALQRFAATMSSLLRAGLPIIDVLEITAESVGHEEIKLALRRISREGVGRGATIGEAFRKEPIFPFTIINLVAISEKAGHLDEILTTLGTFYESEISASIKTLISIVEPVLLLGIGIIVAIVALSIIVPIYQLVGQF